MYPAVTCTSPQRGHKMSSHNVLLLCLTDHLERLALHRGGPTQVEMTEQKKTRYGETYVGLRTTKRPTFNIRLGAEPPRPPFMTKHLRELQKGRHVRRGAS